MMKNLVEGKQENGSKGGENVATSKIYFRGLKVEDRLSFKDMFRISATDYETLLNQISKLISQNERISGNKFILS